MNRCRVPLMLATILAVAQVALAEDAPPGLICRVEGYDVALINRGDTAVEADTVIAWSVPFARAEGQHDLDRPLAPGSLIMLNGVLGSSYLGPGTECLLDLVPEVR